MKTDAEGPSGHAPHTGTDMQATVQTGEQAKQNAPGRSMQRYEIMLWSGEYSGSWQRACTIKTITNAKTKQN